MSEKSNKGKRKDFMQKAGIAAGAAVVGAAAGAAAVALSNPETRKKVSAGIKKFKSQVEDKRDDLAKQVDNAKKQLAKKLD